MEMPCFLKNKKLAFCAEYVSPVISVGEPPTLISTGDYRFQSVITSPERRGLALSC